jgi:flagellar basal body-associated protein FliL
MSPFGMGSRKGMLIVVAIVIPLVLVLLGYIIATFLPW